MLKKERNSGCVNDEEGLLSLPDDTHHQQHIVEVAPFPKMTTAWDEADASLSDNNRNFPVAEVVTWNFHEIGHAVEERSRIAKCFSRMSSPVACRVFQGIVSVVSACIILLIYLSKHEQECIGERCGPLPRPPMAPSGSPINEDLIPPGLPTASAIPSRSPIQKTIQPPEVGLRRFQAAATLLGHSKTVCSVAFNPSGTILASGSLDKSIIFWDSATYKRLRSFAADDGYILALAFDQAGDVIASAGGQAVIHLWDFESSVALKSLAGHTAPIISVKFNAKAASMLASGSRDKTVKVWNGTDGRLIQTLQHSEYVYPINFHPGGELLVSGSGTEVNVWSLSSGDLVRILQNRGSIAMSLEFNPREHDILASGNSDMTIALWDVRTTDDPLIILRGHSGGIMSVSFDPRGDILASGSSDMTIKLWDWRKGNELQSLTGHTSRIWTVAFNPIGDVLASGGDDNTIMLWRKTR